MVHNLLIYFNAISMVECSKVRDFETALNEIVKSRLYYSCPGKNFFNVIHILAVYMNLHTLWRKKYLVVVMLLYMYVLAPLLVTLSVFLNAWTCLDMVPYPSSFFGRILAFQRRIGHRSFSCNVSNHLNRIWNS